MSSEIDKSIENTPKQRYWDYKFVVLNAIILIIIVIIGYFQFYYYPRIMLAAGFEESNLSLVLSFLTYRYDFNRCNQSCPGPRLAGVPALDFVQVFLIAMILVHVSHYLGYRKMKI